MNEIEITTDVDARSLVASATFDASVERVWQLWADPRQLERWWGPPGYPATVVDHDLRAGGHVRYFMTGPEGEKHEGWWRVTHVAAPTELAFQDGFADDEGRPVDDMPVTTSQLRIVSAATGGTQMVLTSTFPSTEAMDELLAMQMDEGLRGAMEQIPALLADG